MFQSACHVLPTENKIFKFYPFLCLWPTKLPKTQKHCQWTIGNLKMPSDYLNKFKHSSTHLLSKLMKPLKTLLPKILPTKLRTGQYLSRPIKMHENAHEFKSFQEPQNSFKIHRNLTQPTWTVLDLLRSGRPQGLKSSLFQPGWDKILIPWEPEILHQYFTVWFLTLTKSTKTVEFTGTD